MGTCLVDMFAKCGKLDVVGMVFENLAPGNVVTWTAMIYTCGYGTNHDGRRAVACFEEMTLTVVEPDFPHHVYLPRFLQYAGVWNRLVSEG